MKDETKERYARAYTEVLEILRYVPKESVDKIPESMLNMFKRCCDKNHDYHIDTSKSFEEQAMSEETRAILANIFRDYWATPEQRKAILKKEEQDRNKMKLQQYENMLKKDNDA